jgi:hypothetical protein
VVPTRINKLAEEVKSEMVEEKKEKLLRNSSVHDLLKPIDSLFIFK